MISPTRSTIAWNRCGSPSFAEGTTRPCFKLRKRLPSLSTTPKPVRRLPGSSPSTRMAASATQLRQHVVGDAEVGVDLLHVFVLLERLDQPQRRARLALRERHLHRRQF